MAENSPDPLATNEMRTKMVLKNRIYPYTQKSRCVSRQKSFATDEVWYHSIAKKVQQHWNRDGRNFFDDGTGTGTKTTGPGPGFHLIFASKHGPRNHHFQAFLRKCWSAVITSGHFRAE